jgi:hypothetical protein
MIEFASPTINRKDALTEDPEGTFLAHLAVAELCQDMTWWRTNYSTDLSNAIDLISYIGGDSDGHVLVGGSHR